MAPLSGIRVLDLTRVRAGPAAVRQLADWGADVIKVEPPPGDEDDETLGGPRNGPDFQNLQRNKRSLTLNLKSEEGRAVLRRLVETADVLVENFRPQVKTRLGIDYEAMRAVNPRMIYASISGFGQEGPYRDRPGFDQVAQGMGGLMSITGQPGEGPMRVGIPIADLCSGIFCAQGILLALLERAKTGAGQWVTTSLLEAQIFMLDFQASIWLNTGEVPRQAGNNHPTSIPTGVFKTTDGYINIAATGQRIWERLCRAIGAESLLAESDYATPEGRSLYRDSLNAEIERHLASAESATWIARLNEAGVPCGQINSIDQVFADPQVQQLEMVQSVPSPHYDPLCLVAQPMQLSGKRPEVRLRPPERGEHTEEVLSSVGYEPGEIAEFRRKGII
jgi:crotonobetainyl-CoA:carnitine CoA-transferase CaiB-like acyl-CoA transferase